MRPRLEGSPRPATPLIILNKTRGTAISLRRLMKRVQNQIDFDKDIDQILKDLENDPDLKIDEEEIEELIEEPIDLIKNNISAHMKIEFKELIGKTFLHEFVEMTAKFKKLTDTSKQDQLKANGIET